MQTVIKACREIVTLMDDIRTMDIPFITQGSLLFRLGDIRHTLESFQPPQKPEITPGYKLHWNGNDFVQVQTEPTTTARERIEAEIEKLLSSGVYHENHMHYISGMHYIAGMRRAFKIALDCLDEPTKQEGEQ